jgi:hypothetical protein
MSLLEVQNLRHMADQLNLTLPFSKKYSSRAKDLIKLGYMQDFKETCDQNIVCLCSCIFLRKCPVVFMIFFRLCDPNNMKNQQ